MNARIEPLVITEAFRVEAIATAIIPPSVRAAAEITAHPRRRLAKTALKGAVNPDLAGRDALRVLTRAAVMIGEANVGVALMIAAVSTTVMGVQVTSNLAGQVKATVLRHSHAPTPRRSRKISLRRISSLRFVVTFGH